MVNFKELSDKEKYKFYIKELVRFFKNNKLSVSEILTITDLAKNEVLNNSFIKIQSVGEEFQGSSVERKLEEN